MLHDYFSGMCNITEARILMNKRKGVSRGVGFVQCATNSEAKKVMGSLNDERLEENGLKLNARFAKIPRTPKWGSQAQQKERNTQPSYDGREPTLSNAISLKNQN